MMLELQTKNLNLYSLLLKITNRPALDSFKDILAAFPSTMELCKLDLRY